MKTIAQKKKLAYAALFLLGIGIVCLVAWTTATLIIMAAAIIGWLLYFGEFFSAKLSALQKGTVGVIELPGKEYAIPERVVEGAEPEWIDRLIHPMRRWQVKYVYPELEGTTLKLHSDRALVADVKRVDPKKRNTPDCERAILMSRAVKTILDIQPKITALEQSLVKAKHHERLGLSSDKFTQRAQTIVRDNVRQLEKSIESLEDSERKCRVFIKDVLIGKALSEYEDLGKLHDLADQTMQQQAQYHAEVGEQAQHMAEDEAALMALIAETSLPVHPPSSPTEQDDLRR